MFERKNSNVNSNFSLIERELSPFRKSPQKLKQSLPFRKLEEPKNNLFLDVIAETMKPVCNPN